MFKKILLLILALVLSNSLHCCNAAKIKTDTKTDKNPPQKETALQTKSAPETDEGEGFDSGTDYQKTDILKSNEPDERDE